MNILFKNLEIKEEIKRALEENNLKETTDIQNLVIDEFLNGKDIIAQAQTGTGKTFAFGIPIVEQITNKKETQAIIMCPTRELALQVFHEILKLTKHIDYIYSSAIIGGESYKQQFYELKKNPQIVVGTPGRIIDHLDRGTLDLSNVTMLTFDEADEMLKMGFKDDIERILKDTPENRQTALFSATIPAEIRRIAKSYQKDAITLKVEDSSLTVDKIEQSYYVVQNRDKMALLERLIDVEGETSVIVFSNTKKDTDEIASYLRDKGYNANSLHGDLNQSERLFVTSNFKNGTLNILVATDVAARGLDISGVNLVINYEIPHEKEVYVHRIGRTARAGESGKAFSILTPRTEYKLRDLEKYINAKIERRDIPSTKAINKAIRNRFVSDVITEFNSEEVYNYTSIINNLTKEGLTLEQITTILIHKLIKTNKDYPEIKENFERRSRNEGTRQSRGNNTRSRRRQQRSDFINVRVNLGRKDNINPPLMLDILGSKFNLRNNSVGNIKFYNTYSIVEVSLDSIQNMNYKPQRFKGKNIHLTVEK